MELLGWHCLAFAASRFASLRRAKAGASPISRTPFSVGEDGSAVVKERITLVFIGEWHGIHRTIPIEYPGPRGTNYTLFLNVTSVTDGDGQKLKYESSTSNGFRDLKIYIPDAVDTTRTVEISYIVRNGIRYFRRSRRVLLERDRQRLAGADRSRRGAQCTCRSRRGIVAGAGLHRRVRLGRSATPRREIQRRGRCLRDHQSAAHARRNDHRRLSFPKEFSKSRVR